MNKLSKVLLATTLIVGLSSCVGTGVSSGPGLLFTSAKEGLMAVYSAPRFSDRKS